MLRDKGFWGFFFWDSWIFVCPAICEIRYNTPYVHEKFCDNVIRLGNSFIFTGDVGNHIMYSHNMNKNVKEQIC